MEPIEKGSILAVTMDSQDLLPHVDALRTTGFRVDLETSGEAVSYRLAQHRPDIVLVDETLEDMDGFELLARIRHPDAYPDLFVILISPWERIFDKLDALDMTHLDFLTIPFHPQETVMRVQRHLALRNLQQCMESQNILLNKEIQERIKAETELKRREQTCRALIQAIPDKILRVNRKGEYIECQDSDRMPECFSGANTYVKPMEDAGFPEPVADQLLVMIQRVLDSEKMERFEYDLMSGPDVQNFEARVIPVHSSEAIVMVRDITQQKQVEKELKAATDLAQAANRSKSLFIANMSHELRTPLNVILGNCQNIRMGWNLDPEALQCLDAIFQSGNHLLTLIDDVLDIASMGNSAFDMNYHEIHFPRFLGDLISIIRVRCEEKGIRFSYEPAHLPEVIISDEKQLRRILLNLLGNAVRFTDENGAVTFRVSCSSCSSGRDGDVAMCQVLFEVSDTGRGIPEDQLNNIFLPFEQISTDDRWLDGIGTGLTMSNYLIGMMGGELRVNSIVGKGSTFWFDLNLEAYSFSDSSEIWPSNSSSSEDTVSDKQTTTTMVAPPPTELNKLYELTKKGVFEQVREHLDRIEAMDIAYGPFVKTIKQFLDTYDEINILSMIKDRL